MARVRQARRCRARRTNGQPCRAWAINGGYVCRAHGGATRAAKRAAEWRLVRASVWREYRAEQERLARELARWQASRVVVAASLLGIAAQDVTERDIFWCAIWHGIPGGPRPQRRRDRRYGRRARRGGG